MNSQFSSPRSRLLPRAYSERTANPVFLCYSGRDDDAEVLSRVVFRVHAIQRMYQRSISEPEVRRVIVTEEMVEDYPDDTPYPSRLVLGWHGQ